MVLSGVKPIRNFWQALPVVKSHVNQDSLLTNSQHPFALKFLSASVENDVVNSQLVRTFADNFYKLIGRHNCNPRNFSIRNFTTNHQRKRPCRERGTNGRRAVLT